MTTERQTKANLANAEKSTGPRSSAGRRRSSKNARKHGLTAPPLWEDVTKWFRVILDDPDATPDPMEREDRQRVALRLAEAEAQLQRCQETERAHLTRMLDHTGVSTDRSTKDTIKRALKDPSGIDALKMMIKSLDDPLLVGGAKILIRTHPDRPAALRRDMHSFRRYRCEAEGRRRKALSAWISHIGQNKKKYETNPNTSIG